MIRAGIFQLLAWWIGMYVFRANNIIDSALVTLPITVPGEDEIESAARRQAIAGHTPVVVIDVINNL